jgi:hypothetical protein
MTVIDATEAGTFLTTVTGHITSNMPGLLVLLGGAVGISVAFGLFRFGLAKLGGAWKS